MIMHLSGDTEPLSLTMENKYKDDYEDFKENCNGAAVSPPISSHQSNPSPGPTLVHDRREHQRSMSPSTGTAPNIPNLHQTLHGLHNLQSLQNLQSQMAALAGLQGSLCGPSIGSLLHPHLGTQQHQQHASSHAERSPLSSPVDSNNLNSVNSNNALPGGGISQGAVPQMVLTSGQVSDGVQGAQLLIPTSQGVAVQPILTIPLRQAGAMSSSSSGLNINSLASLQHLVSPPQTTQAPTSTHLNQQHLTSHSGSSSNSSPMTSTASPTLSSISQSLLGVLPPSLFQNAHHAGLHQQNNNNIDTTNHGNVEKPKISLPISSPISESFSSLGSRYSGSHYRQHHPAPSRYSPDFLDTHNQPTISQATGNMVDGVNLDDIREFAKAFKIRRLSLGLTQTQVGQALSITEGPAYSQSAICRYKNGQHNLSDFMGNEPSKKRKRRTSFTPQALEILNGHFERITHPSGAEITAMGEQLGYDREVVRIWFCNKRQALKNTVRMMSKGHQSHVPISQQQHPIPPHSSMI